MASRASHNRIAADYKTACTCPLGIEPAPVESMLDGIYDRLSRSRNQNAYTMGHVGEHDAVTAVMPEIGNDAATAVANQLVNDYPAVSFGLLEGIDGGVPGTTGVRLGDVVVSQATDMFGGVVQYNLGQRMGGSTFRREG